MSGSCSFSDTRFIGLLILILSWSYILSHPFSCLIFLSRCLLKVVSFLSPLFVTSFLLFLAFLIGPVRDNVSAELAVDYLSTAYTSVLGRLWSSKGGHENDDVRCSEDLGMYELLIGSSETEEVKGKENPIEILKEKSVESPPKGSEGSDKRDLCNGKIETFEGNKVEKKQVPCPKVMEGERLTNFLKILDEFERMASNVEEKKKLEPLRGRRSNATIERKKAVPKVRRGSEPPVDKLDVAAQVGVNDSNGEKEDNSMVKIHSRRTISSVDHTYGGGRGITLRSEGFDGTCERDGENRPKVGVFDKESPLEVGSFQKFDHCSFGTQRSNKKDREWRRTLACKLFEERHGVDGGEGMDSLWEAYEMASNKPTMQEEEKEKEKEKKKVTRKVEYQGEEEDEEEVAGQLCCLQAWRLSAGKVNLGIGRPNVVKVTKALKGIGWLHLLSKRSKKVHNKDSDSSVS